jgi:hypothetical protein
MTRLEAGGRSKGIKSDRAGSTSLSLCSRYNAGAQSQDIKIRQGLVFWSFLAVVNN